MSFLALDKRRSHDSESNMLRSLRVQKEFLRFCKEQAYAQHFYKYIKDRPLVVRHPPELSQELFVGLQEFYGIKPKKARKKRSKTVPTGPVYTAVTPNLYRTIETSEDDE